MPIFQVKHVRMQKLQKKRTQKLQPTGQAMQKASEFASDATKPMSASPNLQLQTIHQVFDLNYSDSSSSASSDCMQHSPQLRKRAFVLPTFRPSKPCARVTVTPRSTPTKRKSALAPTAEQTSLPSSQPLKRLKTDNMTLDTPNKFNVPSTTNRGVREVYAWHGSRCPKLPHLLLEIEKHTRQLQLPAVKLSDVPHSSRIQSATTKTNGPSAQQTRGKTTAAAAVSSKLASKSKIPAIRPRTSKPTKKPSTPVKDSKLLYVTVRKVKTRL
jgi:hypothetical protein